MNNSIKRKPIFFVIILLIGTLLFSYNFFHKEKVYANYSVLKTDQNDERKFLVSVRISEKLSDDKLKDIAQKVKDNINAVSDMGAISFLLPEMEEGNGAWAIVEFNPEMQVRIIGQSISDERKVNSEIDNITDYSGLWSDNGEQGDVIIRIRKDKLQGYVFEYISPSDPKPSELASPLKKITKNNKIEFLDLENKGDYMIIEDNGDLSCYDKDGFISTYKKLK